MPASVITRTSMSPITSAPRRQLPPTWISKPGLRCARSVTICSTWGATISLGRRFFSDRQPFFLLTSKYTAAEPRMAVYSNGAGDFWNGAEPVTSPPQGPPAAVPVRPASPSPRDGWPEREAANGAPSASLVTARLVERPCLGDQTRCRRSTSCRTPEGRCGRPRWRAAQRDETGHGRKGVHRGRPRGGRQHRRSQRAAEARSFPPARGYGAPGWRQAPELRAPTEWHARLHRCLSTAPGSGGSSLSAPSRADRPGRRPRPYSPVGRR